MSSSVDRGDLAERLAGHRGRVLEVLATRRRHPLAADEVAVARLVRHQSVGGTRTCVNGHRITPLIVVDGVTQLTLRRRDRMGPVADDPYLWLEDITGDDALDWVRRHNDPTLAELVRRPVRADARRGARGARHRCAHPVRPAPRRVPVQLLARRGQPARAVAAHHAGQLPHRRTRMGRGDRRRCTGRRRRRELGVGRRQGHRTRPLPGADRPVARRLGRRGRARVRHAHSANSSPAASSCPRPRRRSAGRTRTPCWSAPTSARAR